MSLQERYDLLVNKYGDGKPKVQTVMGPPGLTGLKGDPGLKGSKGDTGAKGDKGDKGDSVVGPQGPMGPSGPSGLSGLKGDIGPQGHNGLNGPTGERGPKGNIGSRGMQGKVGPRGPKGPRGPQGVKGKDGVDGTDGSNGSTPKHEIKDKRIRFQDPDGKWGKWINLSNIYKGGGGIPDAPHDGTQYARESGTWTTIDANAIQYLVGPLATGAPYQTIQAAVDAIEASGANGVALVLPGQYTEDVTITKSGVSLHGFASWATCGTCLTGNLTYNATETAVNAVSELHMVGVFSILGAQNTQVWADGVSVEAEGGLTPVVLSNTSGSSTFIPHKFRATEISNLAPALVMTTNMNLDGDDLEFRRNGESGSNNLAVDLSTFTGDFLVRGCRIKGQLKSNSSAFIDYRGGDIITAASKAPVNLFGSSGYTVMSNVFLTAGTGGNAFYPTTNALLFYSNMTANYGTTLTSTMGYNLAVDGVRLLSDSSLGGKFLSNDGTYKAASSVPDTLVQVTEAYTVLATDSIIEATGTFDVTLPSLVPGKRYNIVNAGSGTVTIKGLINGTTDFDLGPEEALGLYANSTGWRAL